MPIRHAAPAVATACALLVLVLVAPASAAPRPVPCSAAGGSRYNCEWYVPGDGRTGGAKVMVDRAIVGYLHQGTNWITCQQRGAMTRNPAGNRNSWYGWTQSDHGGAGWASAVEARGGDDDGPFRGVPGCGGAHGPAPAWGGVWGATAAPEPSPAPPGRRPAVPACSSLRTSRCA